MQDFWKEKSGHVTHLATFPALLHQMEKKTMVAHLAWSQIWLCHLAAVALGNSLPCSVNNSLLSISDWGMSYAKLTATSQPRSSQRIWSLPHLLESPSGSQTHLWLHPWLDLNPSPFSWRDRFPWRRRLHILSLRTLTLMVLIAGTLAGHPSSSMFLILYYEE